MALNKKQTFLIAALIVIVVNLLLSLIPSLKNLDVSKLLDTIAAVIPIIGLFSESKRKKEETTPSTYQKTLYHLNISFESGIYGGIIGGILSGAVVAISVYTEQIHPPLVQCLKIVPYCATIGILFGGLIYVGRKIFDQVAFLNSFINNLLGCLVGCLVAGTLSGMLGMWLFGDAPFTFVGNNKIVIATIIGALGLISGTLIYDYEGKLKYFLFSLFVGLILSAFISMIGYLLFANQAIAKYLDSRIYSQDEELLLQGGAVIGVIMGFVAGLIIGFTIVFYNYWKFAGRQQKLTGATEFQR
jgi:hypothetical protein